MSTPILILDSTELYKAVVCLGSLCPITISATLYNKQVSRFDFLLLHCILMFVLVVFFCLAPIVKVTDLRFSLSAVQAFLSFGTAYVYFRFDKWITLSSANQTPSVKSSHSPAPRVRRIERTTGKISTRKEVGRRTGFAILQTNQNWSIQQTSLSLILFVLAGLFEELLFRYSFLTLFFSPMNLVLSALLFGASHIFFGWKQVLGKSVLGSLCAISVALTHSCTPAILIHCIFNFFVWKTLHPTVKGRTVEYGFPKWSFSKFNWGKL